ncbi:MAG: hypothetical protein HRU30_16360 [Rhodobacteraceae bacterium]|nr:hypothetical protein [Paracoccaceae bacterium]
MSENPKHAKPTPLGIYDKPRSAGITDIEIIAIVLTVIWLVGSVAFFVFVPDATLGGADTLQFLMTLLAIFMPAAMIWVAATAARSSRIMREESQRLETAIDAMRQTYIAQAQTGAQNADNSIAKKLDEIAEATKKLESAQATFSTARRPAPALEQVAAPVLPTADEQTALALGTSAEDMRPPVDTLDFIRALNFPETAEDEDGFAALRRAMKDRSAAQMVQAAQDILTLLSQDGIYMDDLRPDRARPEVWRAFAEGTRGREIAGLGGIRDRSSLALAAGRMKQDPIFRDTAHHFLRRFDQTFASFAKAASDEDIAAFADTRTARAFMLLGRVAGTFD